MPVRLTEQTMVGDMLHEWTVREYEEHDRDTRWLIVMIVIGLGFVLYGMVSGNFLFSLIIILFSIILFLQSHQEPLEVPFAITTLGIIVSNRFYLYSDFHQFYLIYNPPEVKTLFLETKHFLRPTLRISLEDMNPVEIRRTLRKNLEEDLEREEEPYSEQFSRQWKLH